MTIPASETLGSEIPTLTVGIPAGRNLEWTSRILAQLDTSFVDAEVLVARSAENNIATQELAALNELFPTRQVRSAAGHSPAMRNAIVREAESTHILFLDDDMVPGQGLLDTALELAKCEPHTVYQGIPYRVANTDSWLARTEGTLYERGYQKYINLQDNTVRLLDARLILAPTETLRDTPFDESLVFSSGEGTELAMSLIEKGIVLRLARELNASHVNRDTIVGLAQQKRIHGMGRGYELRHHGPGKNGWLDYCVSYTKRHYVEPAVRRSKGEIGTGEMLYVWGTNTAMWAGVFEYLLRASCENSKASDQ